MKQTKFITLPLLLIGISLVSMTCKEKEKEIAYYQFTPEDNQRLLPYTKGQVLKFTNQNNKERTFTVQSVSTTKEQLVISPGFMEDRTFYYDTKEITITDSDTKKRFYTRFSRYPLDRDLSMSDKYTKHPSKFYGSIIQYIAWNGTGKGISIDYNQEKTIMTVNGKTYKNVFVIDSGSDSIIEEKYPNGDIIYRDINVIYYDEIEGFIGFDDLNGNEWRLSN
jgi:hypothetical protein